MRGHRKLCHGEYRRLMVCILMTHYWQAKSMNRPEHPLQWSIDIEGFAIVDDQSAQMVRPSQTSIHPAFSSPLNPSSTQSSASNVASSIGFGGTLAFGLPQRGHWICWDGGGLERSVEGGVVGPFETETSAAVAVACACGVSSIESSTGILSSGDADLVTPPTGNVGVGFDAVFSCACRSRTKGHSGEHSICS